VIDEVQVDFETGSYLVIGSYDREGKCNNNYDDY
jgi:hypothetical protein